MDSTIGNGSVDAGLVALIGKMVFTYPLVFAAGRDAIIDIAYSNDNGQDERECYPIVLLTIRK